MSKKKVKYGRLALIVFLGIQLGLVSLLFHEESDLLDERVLSNGQLYFCMGFLVFVYVLYLKLATRNVVEDMHNS